VTSQPLLTQSVKLILVSDHEEFLFFCYGPQKVMLGEKLFAKLSGPVYGWI
jgi:hypothetical protein